MAPPISTLGLQKAAILMVLLGEESASHIYRNLPEGDVERLTRRIAELEHFKPETAMSVLEEYYQLTLTQGYLAEGGPDYAQKLLVKAFGEAGAQRLLDQASRTMEQNAVQLESLQEADPQQLGTEGEQVLSELLEYAHVLEKTMDRKLRWHLAVSWR